VPNVPDNVICPRCARTDYHVHMEQLDDVECYALAYARAVIEGGRYAAEFQARDEQVRLTASDKKRLLNRGLRLLHEKWGLVSLARDAEGGHQPAQVHTERIVGSSLVLGELN